MSTSIEKALIETQAFKVSSSLTTWASGIKSPIYCDNRVILSFPKHWKVILKSFEEKIRQLDIDGIAAVATAGIPHGAALAHIMGLPLVYVRSKAKGHGKENLIEGNLNEVSKVVLIEDLLSTGGSALSASKELVSKGVEVDKILSIFSYELKVLKSNMIENKCDYYSLTNIHKVLKESNLNTSQQSLVDGFLTEYVI